MVNLKHVEMGPPSHKIKQMVTLPTISSLQPFVCKPHTQLVHQVIDWYSTAIMARPSRIPPIDSATKPAVNC